VGYIFKGPEEFDGRMSARIHDVKQEVDTLEVCLSVRQLQPSFPVNEGSHDGPCGSLDVVADSLKK
jgi:hypothetical protein